MFIYCLDAIEDPGSIGISETLATDLFPYIKEVGCALCE